MDDPFHPNFLRFLECVDETTWSPSLIGLMNWAETFFDETLTANRGTEDVIIFLRAL